jgi:hypothetical protein
MQADTQVLDPVLLLGTFGTLTLTHSVFVNRPPRVLPGRLVADSCLFLSGGPLVAGSIVMSNSVVVASPTQTALSISSTDPMNARSELINNTFVGGSILCEDSNSAFRNFNSNLFFDQKTIQSSLSCAYNYNLVTPSANVGGIGNTTGDPLFMDAVHNDFHLKLHSPAIDAADPNLLSNGHDYDGTSRPRGVRVDIGAFEHP